MSENKEKLAFKKENYRLMLIGIAVLFLGFFVMASDSTTFGFGFLGLTLGPILVLLGFMIQFGAILFKPKK
jgi:Protein of unknown function (DUF3098)